MTHVKLPVPFKIRNSKGGCFLITVEHPTVFILNVTDLFRKIICFLCWEGWVLLHTCLESGCVWGCVCKKMILASFGSSVKNGHPVKADKKQLDKQWAQKSLVFYCWNLKSNLCWIFLCGWKVNFCRLNILGLEAASQFLPYCKA